jgi:hypothetical protein
VRIRVKKDLWFARNSTLNIEHRTLNSSKDTGNQLLVDLLREENPGDKIRRFQGLSPSDWESLFPASIRHGVAPLLYGGLKPFIKDAYVPATVQERLNKSYRLAALRNMRLYQQLSKVLAVLNQEGIPVIPLKGAFLAEVVYGDTGLRPMTDVDLLVRQADLAKTDKALLALGYRRSAGEVGSATEHVPPYRKKGWASIEMHFNIAGPPVADRIDLDGLWGRTRRRSLAGIGILELSPEDLLLHLCLHAAIHHAFDNGLRGLYDISRTIRYYAGELDWEQLIHRAGEWGVGNCVYLSLVLARKLTGVHVPDHVVHQTEPVDGTFDAVALSEEFIFNGGSWVPPNVALLWGAQSLRHRIAHLVRIAFPPRTQMAAQAFANHPLQVYLSYPLRLGGLLRRHSNTAWRLLGKDAELSAHLEKQNRKNALVDWLLSA